MVILIFIFLTPNRWFSVGERPRCGEHQSPIAKTLILGPEVIANEADKEQIEQLIRTMTGCPNPEVSAVRKMVGQDGKTIGFEVDIR